MIFRLIYANHVLDIQRLFNLAIHLSTVAWTSPRAPSDTVLDIIATHGVRNIAFSQYVPVSLAVILKETSVYQATTLAQY